MHAHQPKTSWLFVGVIILFRFVLFRFVSFRFGLLLLLLLFCFVECCIFCVLFCVLIIICCMLCFGAFCSLCSFILFCFVLFVTWLIFRRVPERVDPRRKRYGRRPSGRGGVPPRGGRYPVLRCGRGISEVSETFFVPSLGLACCCYPFGSACLA